MDTVRRFARAHLRLPYDGSAPSRVIIVDLGFCPPSLDQHGMLVAQPLHSQQNVPWLYGQSLHRARIP
jgi:hypothetical protein